MKTKIKLLPVFSLILLVLTVSCKKNFLDTIPKTNIIAENAFDTPERILGQINGLYKSAKSGQFLGGRFLIYNDIRAEEFINRTNNGFTGFQTWNHTLASSTTEVENLWIAAYLTINRTNLFIQGLEENAAKINANDAKQYKAEAKFLRALCYFDLLSLYARPYTLNDGTSPGLPLRLNGEASTDNNDLARSSVRTGYDQILKDLNEAEADLPANYTTALLNVTRAHKNAAIALKTRVYLSMGKYSDVVTEAKKIVSDAAPFKANSGVAHKLEANVATPFTTYTTTESVFSLPMTDNDAPGTQNQLGYYYNKPTPGNGEYFLNTKGIIGNTEWRAKDERRINFLVADGGNTYLKKFNKPSPYTDFIPVIRYAEILLNYAEALARTGNLSQSLALLTAVRNRSDATYIFPSENIDTADELIKTILTERRIELLGEGFRSIDLLRLGQTIPAKGAGTSLANAIQPSQTEYIWPIPQSELSANKAMTPNN
jgi:starch-binding outer membrane protein, SusD/RagB family